MKWINKLPMCIVTLFMSGTALTAMAGNGQIGSATGSEAKAIFTDKRIVQLCPERFIGYIDKAEGGPGTICECPQENVNYIDKAEGGPGTYCAETAVSTMQQNATSNLSDIQYSPNFIATCPYQYLSYLDKADGGVGAYCNCPEDKISYLDKADGGNGAYCKP